jgi:chromosome segregation ATPase
MLRNTFLAEDLETAFSAAGDNANARFITRNGEVVKKGFQLAARYRRPKVSGLIGRDAR